MTQQPSTITVNQRQCSNCYFFNSKRGNVCQRWPMHTHALSVPGPGGPMIKVPGAGQTLNLQTHLEGTPRPASPDYCCREHRYDREMTQWRFDDPEFLSSPVAL
jgi:hypothetical protein